uniref:Ribosomal RNA-processing protein 44 n=1 Tax=Brassica oleracea TaxID=3712 RepID=A0A3P6F9D6_BRAOL|nr:unnamed protein product [Brassica oleracea]
MYNRIRALCSNQAKQFYVFSNHVHKNILSAIRVPTLWYQKHLADTSQVLLVTNDRENERKATEEGISAETKSRAYVKSIGQPELPSKRKLVGNGDKHTSYGLCGIYHQGKLRVNPFEAYVGSENEEGDDTKLALVLWSLEPMSLPGGTAHSLFVSKDRRIPRFALTLDSFRTFLDMRIVVAVDSWGCQSRYPSGHYVRPIGKIVLSCLPPLPWSVSAEDVSDPVRQDLRHLLVFSVDPSGMILMMHCIALNPSVVILSLYAGISMHS